MVLINREEPGAEVIDQARAVLAAGGLVIVPTETVYGIACDPLVPGAMERLIEAKGRDGNKPIARLAASPQQVQSEALHWNTNLQALAEAFWPGPLTIVLETASGWTGYRVPDHAVALKLAETVGHTLALTSANQSGGADPKTAEDAADAVVADLILDSGAASEEAIPSTVIKVDERSIECLRAGCLPFEQVENIFNKGAP